MRKVLQIFVVLFTIVNLNAQELDCSITVNADKIPGSNKQIFTTLEINDQFESKAIVDLTATKGLITQHYIDKWSHEVTNMPKLRTYRLFKTDFKCEDYMTESVKIRTLVIVPIKDGDITVTNRDRKIYWGAC